MKALDTNALVRFLVKDDEKQAKAVRAVLKEAENKGEALHITDPVILETIWVLSSVYEYPRNEIIRALENLLMLTVLEIQSHERLLKLCRIAKNSAIDLADLYIGIAANEAGCETMLTFDKKASKSDFFTFIPH